MKKLIALLLVVAFVSTGIVGCGGGETTKPTAPSGGKPTPPTGGGAPGK